MIMSEEKSSPIKIIAIVFVIAVFVGCESNNYPETANKNEQLAAKPTEPAKPEVLVFDPNRGGHRDIETDIRERLGKPSGVITREDMAKLKSLGGYRGVSDIAPMKAAIHVETIDLGHNQVSDLSPLAGMSKLRRLDLGVNRLTDLAPLAGLSNLRELQLQVNQLTDLSPLTGLKQLTTLRLSGNPKLPRAEIDKLQKALPNCKITHSAKN